MTMYRNPRNPARKVTTVERIGNAVRDREEVIVLIFGIVLGFVLGKL